MPYPYDQETLDALDNLQSYYNGGDYDAATNPGGFGHGGHRVNFIPSLRDIATVGDSVGDATAVAQTAADQASNYATALKGTSTTGTTIGTGSKTFTTQSGKTFPNGGYVLIASNSDATNFMHGQVTSYSGTTLVVNVNFTGGSGTYNNWDISLSAPRGPTGMTGETGAPGLAGLRFRFSISTTNSDPGSGYFRLNNSTPASATALYISETDVNAASVAGLLSMWDDGTSTIKGLLLIVDSSDLTKFLTYTISGTMTDNGAWDTFTIGNGTGTLPTNDAICAVLFIPKGDKGDTGASGAVGNAGGGININYLFATATGDADPGNGNLRLNSGTQNTSTVVRADLLDVNGADFTTALDYIDDSTTTGSKGQLRIYKTTDPTAFIVFNVTALAAPSGYRNITVSVLASSSSNPFAQSDPVALTFTRTGDTGGGPANLITFSPAGNISSTDVQAAIQELDAEKGSSNNAALTGTTDIQQAIKFSGDITPTTITGDQNDYNPSGLATANTIRIASDAARNITGLQGGDDGRMLNIYNIGSFNITLINASTSSSAANRFAFGSNITIHPDECVELDYDSSTQRWRAMSVIRDSAALGGTPTASTAARTVNNTQIATTAFTNSLVRQPATSKSTGFTVTVDDLGKLFVCTTSLTVTLDPAATLGNGFFFDVANVGTNTNAIIIDPNSSETIDGDASAKVAPRQRCTVFCDGSAFHTLGLPLSTRVADLAATGYIGEFLASTASFVFSPGSYWNACNVNLGPGTWLVWGTANFSTSGYSQTMITSISTVSGTLQSPYTQINSYDYGVGHGSLAGNQSMVAPPILYQLSSATTPVYLIIYADGTNASIAISGLIYALRIR